MHVHFCLSWTPEGTSNRLSKPAQPLVKLSEGLELYGLEMAFVLLTVGTCCGLAEGALDLDNLPGLAGL